ncbi:MAG: hypothetical protein NXI22_14715 [bacterium]|nr:hypothetical protein [bacterium]
MRTRQLQWKQIVLAGCTLAVMTAFLGCGDASKNTISGTVTFDGEIVKSGSMVFTPIGEGRTEGANIVDGKYSAEVSVGKNKVAITATKPHPTKTVPNADPDGPPLPLMVEYIPDIFNTKTTLEIDTTTGNEHDFDLKSPK